MKKSYIVYGVLGVIALWALISFNGLTNSREDVLVAAGRVQNAMQRQADLLPNLVETVKGASGFESKTLTAITEARSKLTAVQKMDPAKLSSDPALQKQLIEAQSAGSSLFNMVREAYPKLQSVALFGGLMAQIEGSQNRISVERGRWQTTIGTYNKKRATFPSNVMANAFNFEHMEYFQADEAGKVVPKISFDR